MAVKIVTR